MWGGGNLPIELQPGGFLVNKGRGHVFVNSLVESLL